MKSSRDFEPFRYVYVLYQLGVDIVFCERKSGGKLICQSYTNTVDSIMYGTHVAWSYRISELDKTLPIHNYDYFVTRYPGTLDRKFRHPTELRRSYDGIGTLGCDTPCTWSGRSFDGQLPCFKSRLTENGVTAILRHVFCVPLIGSADIVVP